MKSLAVSFLVFCSGSETLHITSDGLGIITLHRDLHTLTTDEKQLSPNTKSPLLAYMGSLTVVDGTAHAM